MYKQVDEKSENIESLLILLNEMKKEGELLKLELETEREKRKKVEDGFLDSLMQCNVEVKDPQQDIEPKKITLDDMKQWKEKQLELLENFKNEVEK